MRVRDPIYGKIDLPNVVTGLMFSPEFQRLSGIGLINISSPTFAALSDVTRYSHTLGVLFLATKANLIAYSEDEFNALLAALIFHDAGSPAFGHLIEYKLKDRFGFNHEEILVDYLHGTHHPEQGAKQIEGQTLRFKKTCEAAGISIDILESILGGNHPLSKLIFGSLDFDNLDNVVRMAHFLGLKTHVQSVVNIAREMHVSNQELLLPERLRGDVEAWAEMRRSAYDILVFDEIAVARQAVISRAYDIALEDGIVGLGDWDWSERELLRRLQESPRAKRLIRQFYYAAPPHRALHVHMKQTDHPHRHITKAEISNAVNRIAAEYFPGRAMFEYVFRDRGTFSKEMRFRCPDSGKAWTHGAKSEGWIADGFVSGPRLPQERIAAASTALHALLV